MIQVTLNADQFNWSGTYNNKQSTKQQRIYKLNYFAIHIAIISG